MTARKKQKARLINLLPQREFEASLYGRTLKWSLSTFRFIVIAVEVVVIIGFLSRLVLDVQNTDLQEEIDQKKTVIGSFVQVEKEFRRTQQKIDIFKAYRGSKFSSALILDNVVSRMPPEVKLISITVSGEDVFVSAEGFNEQTIAQFVANISDEDTFSEVSLLTAESNSEEPNVHFQLKMSVVETI